MPLDGQYTAQERALDRIADENRPYFQSMGRTMPRWQVGESTGAYRDRIDREYQRYAPRSYHDRDLSRVRFADPPSYDALSKEVREAAIKYQLANPEPGSLRKVVRIDADTGQRMIEWQGDPAAWMRPMMPPYMVSNSQPGAAKSYENRVKELRDLAFEHRRKRY